METIENMFASYIAQELESENYGKQKKVATKCQTQTENPNNPSSHPNKSNESNSTCKEGKEGKEDKEEESKTMTNVLHLFSFKTPILYNFY